MTDLENILPLWHELEASGTDFVLATVVAVEGSSYRKPGARMLLAPDGRRAGTVSGGCLEAEVARRAWWLTADGPVVERYSTVDDDGDLPYGSGCGGVVFLLLERRATARPLLTALQAAFNVRLPLAIATILDGPQIGRRFYAGLPEHAMPDSCGSNDLNSSLEVTLADLAELALSRRASIERSIHAEGAQRRVWVDYRAARPGLWIFGAGDDAKPLLRLARELGWFVAVADGRSHLATQERFGRADVISVLPIKELPDVAENHLPIHSTDAAVVMTHSFEQDSRIVASLLNCDPHHAPAYIGVLGPQRRTREVLVEAARLLHVPATSDRIDKWLAQIHAPMGLDFSAETPATIALSILAEIQQTLSDATALPLRQVRAVGVAAIQS
jgi:xanthine/CO dehydrogenase XdhC/CoxF family maturation factor